MSAVVSLLSVECSWRKRTWQTGTMQGSVHACHILFSCRKTRATSRHDTRIPWDRGGERSGRGFHRGEEHSIHPFHMVEDLRH